MNSFRADNPSVMDEIKPHLIPEPDITKEDFCNEIKSYMKNFPDRIQVLTLWNNEKLVGFCLAYIPNNRSHLFIAQAWVDQSLTNSKWTKIMFDQVKMFAEINDMTEIRAETLRCPETFCRRWGFENYSTIISYDLIERGDIDGDFNGRRYEQRIDD